METMVKTIKLYITFHDGVWQGYTPTVNDWFASGISETEDGVKIQVKGIIDDFIANEGEGDEYWGSIDTDTLEFEIINGDEEEA